MSVRRIIEAFHTWRSRGQPLVLATVYETLGSTYSKAGHRILITAEGDYQGLVSGGCLEGDLAERAHAVAGSGEPAAVTYDLRDDADDLWGLGVGCNGLIKVFLQPLSPAAGYEPFASIAERLLGTEGGAAATVVASTRPEVAPGATLVAAASSADVSVHGLDSTGWAAAALSAGCRRVLAAGRAELAKGDDGLDVLYAPLVPVPRVLVLGAGLDAVPLVELTSALGWRVTVADHRPAYLARGGFSRADRVLEVDPRRLAAQVPLAEYDAILIMSHHLDTDRVYLSQTAEAPARFLGVLGPPARRARLLDALGDAGERLRPRLKGPIGLDLGADSPESIALSIVAELQAVFAKGTVRQGG